MKYTGQTKADFQLKDDTKTELGEVTVTANRRDNMGITKMERTSSVQSINLADIVDASPVTSIEDALQGQISGLDITMGGDPGAKNTMQIRGTNTLTGDANPLIVVDGVPYDANISDDFDFATANSEDFGALLNIAPSNIESIDVLKDGAATAIYGSKGSNGVLLINTKKGAMGKTRFNFSSKWTVKQEPSSIPLLNGRQYTAMMRFGMQPMPKACLMLLPSWICCSMQILSITILIISITTSIIRILIGWMRSSRMP